VKIKHKETDQIFEIRYERDGIDWASEYIQRDDSFGWDDELLLDTADWDTITFWQLTFYKMEHKDYLERVARDRFYEKNPNVYYYNDYVEAFNDGGFVDIDDDIEKTWNYIKELDPEYTDERHEEYYMKFVRFYHSHELLIRNLTESDSVIDTAYILQTLFDALYR